MSGGVAARAIPAEVPALRQKIGFAATVVGLFMAILDIQIVSASLAEIQAGLSAAPDEASWIQTSYLIAEIVMIPLSGFLSRALSTRVLFVASAIGFTLCSLACAMATTLNAMIVARALQGFAGGAMIPICFAVSFMLFSGQKRVQTNVMIALTATLAPTIGPTLGGWLTQTWSWHALFLINLPIGPVVAIVAWLTLDVDRADLPLLRRLDWLGLALMAGFLGTLEYVMEEGPRWDWFDDAGIRTLATISAVCAGLFLWRTLTRVEPIVELRTFRNGNFLAGCLFSMVVGSGLYGLVYVLPLFLSRVRGFDSMEIGVTLAITGAFMFGSAPLAGMVARRVDLRAMMASGFVMFAVACWWLARLTSQSGFWDMAGPLALRGTALIFMFMPANQIAFGTLAPASLKDAAGLYNLMRNMGGALGLAAINTIVTTRSATHRLHLAEQAQWARPGVANWMDVTSARLSLKLDAASDLVTLKQVYLIVQREALVLAYNDVLLLMAAMFVLAIPFAALVAKPRLGAAGGH